MDYTIPEILDACVGEDKNNKPNSVFTFNIEKIFNNEIREKQTELSFYDPVVSFQKVDNFFIVQLKFKNIHSISFRNLWSLLKSNNEKITNYEVGQKNDFVLESSLTIVPLNYNGSIFIVAKNYILSTLTATNISDMPDTITLLFNDKDVAFFKGEKIDVQKLKNSILTKQKQEQEYYDAIQLKKLEQEMYQDELNEKMKIKTDADKTPLEKLHEQNENKKTHHNY